MIHLHERMLPTLASGWTRNLLVSIQLSHQGLPKMVTTVQIYEKENNSKMGDNSDKKKKCRLPIFFMRNKYMKFQKLAHMVLKLCYAQESNNIKWPKISKSHNSNNIFFNWLKI